MSRPFRRSVAAMVGLLACATAAYAAVPEATFKIGVVPLKMPIPEGFCLPNEDQASLAAANADADRQNVTLATLLACNRNPEVKPWSNYILIKAPVALANGWFERAATLNQMEQVLSGPDSPKFDAKATKEIAKETERALGVPIQITGTFGYAGRDAECVYLAGPMQAEAAGKTIKGLIASCITVTGGKMFAVNLYRIVETPDLAMLKEMKAQARQIALSVRR